MSPADPTKRHPVSRLQRDEARVTRQIAASDFDFRLDLHGMTVVEADEAIERHIWAAVARSLPFVHFIHGYGSGALREAVRKKLAGHPEIARQSLAGPGEGGPGVTVAELKSGQPQISREQLAKLSAPVPRRRKQR